MTMRFTFGADGLIESVRADARGALVGGKVVYAAEPFKNMAMPKTIDKFR